MDREFLKALILLGFDLKKSYAVNHNNSWRTLPASTGIYRHISNHILKKQNTALREYNNTKILAIDIDTHEIGKKYRTNPDIGFKNAHREIINKSLLFLNTILESSPIYMETSEFYSGVHIYYQCDSNVTDEVKKTLGNIYRDHIDNEIEFRTKSKPLRIPLSQDYTSEIPISRIKSNIDSIKPAGLENIRKFQNIESIFTRKKSCSENKFIEYCKKNYPITAYHRHRNMLAIGFKAAGYQLDLNAYMTAITECNINSRDLAKWNYAEFEKNCKNYYDFCISNYKNIYENEYFDFISNIPLLSNKEKKNLKIISDLIPINKKYKKSYEKNKFAVDIILREVYGYYKYNKSNEKEISNCLLRKSTKENLCKGFYISPKFLERLKNHYQLEVNVYQLWNLIQKELLLGSVLIKLTNYSNFSIYRYGIHYTVDISIVKYIISLLYSNIWNQKNIVIMSDYFTENEVKNTVKFNTS